MSKPKSKSASFIHELDIMLRARMSVAVVTDEEARFFRLFRDVFKSHASMIGENKLKLLSWSLVEGLQDITSSYKKDHKPVVRTTLDTFQNKIETEIVSFSDLCNYFKETSHCKDRMIILKDADHLLDKNHPNHAIILRHLYILLQFTKSNDADIIFLSSRGYIPPELDTDIQVLDMPRPDEINIAELLNSTFADIHMQYPDIKFDIDFTNRKGVLVKSEHPKAQSLREKVIMNLRGLTEQEIIQILKYICAKHYGVSERSIKNIIEAKKKIIEKNGVLSIISLQDTIEIGGHDIFKEYIDQKGLYLNLSLRAKYHLPAPKGLLAVGLSGAGKSLMAKYIAKGWNIPLIRFNLDAIFAKYLGESEDNLRTALSIAEANSPCVLFIDEIDKGLGGISSSGDSGTGMRILGKILTWMQERKEMVFLFATANQVGHLPPELLRAGRFDAKFWVDLPSQKDCKEILKIKVRDNGLSLSEEEYEKLAVLSFKRQMTGAEIEQAVLQSLYSLANDGDRISNCGRHIRKAIEQINSHASMHQEQLDKERKLAFENYIFTSNEIKKVVEKLLTS